MPPEQQRPLQPLLNIGPPTPEKCLLPDDLLSLRLKIQSWILRRIAADRELYADEKPRVAKELMRLETCILDQDTALRYVQVATPADFNSYPVFYRALWELMKKELIKLSSW